MKRRSLVELFESCRDVKSLAQLHSHGLKSGQAHHDSFFATKLNALYGLHGCLADARKVFDETSHRTVYLWNAALKGYCENRRWAETLHLFNQMISAGFTDYEKPDKFTIPIGLKACSCLRAVGYGKMVHGYVKKNEEIALNVFVGAALVEMYSRCGQMNDALKVFQEYSRPDIVLWTSMITAYEQNGYPEKAIAFFSDMVAKESFCPDAVVLVGIVSASAQLLNCRLGNCVLGFVIRKGFDTYLPLVNALLNLYAKVGSVKIAINLFRNMPKKDVISWSSIVACYAQNRAAVEAIDIFKEMIDLGYEPNAATIVSALQACGIACNLEVGKELNGIACQKGLDIEIAVSNALIHMYMRCSSPDEAVGVFERMPKKNVVSWAALFSGYTLNGMAHKSMELFRDMLSSEIRPDAVAMVNILTSCSELGILRQANSLHGYIIRSGFNSNTFIGASLIESYSKCGSLDNAIKVFEGIFDKDVVTWSAMITGYGVHGKAGEALNIFYQMVKGSAVRPNTVTFLAILSACSHAGFIEKGIQIFHMMVNQYHLNPNSEHYGIMVDLLGRKGELDKALDFINHMPGPAGAHIWGALLGASRIHNNIEMGELAAQKLFNLDPDHTGYYTLMSNIYAVNGKWDKMTKLRTLIKEKGLRKINGQSMVEVGAKIHSFVAYERLHPKCEQIYELLSTLEVEMREEGYTPGVECPF